MQQLYIHYSVHVTGTAPALREVGGKFAVYVDPEDVDALAEHMRELAETASDPNIKAARIAWTRQFSWDSSTSTVYDALRRISK